MLEPCLPALGSWPGGGGGGTAICANALAAKTAAAQMKSRRQRREKIRLRKDSVAGGVVSGLRIDAKRRKPFGGAQLDLEFSPASVVSLVAWSISENILVSQLHADF